MTADLGAFSAQCAAFPAKLRTAQRAASKQAGDGLRAAVDANTRAAVRSGVLSNVGSGARVGGVVEVLRNGSGAIVKVIGPYQLIERDTKPHTIPRRRRNQKVLNIPGIGYRRSVHHPGTRGKGPFEKAVKSFGPKVPRMYQRQLAVALQQAFRSSR